jgi:hypothetical protein
MKFLSALGAWLLVMLVWHLADAALTPAPKIHPATKQPIIKTRLPRTREA